MKLVPGILWPLFLEEAVSTVPYQPFILQYFEKVHGIQHGSFTEKCDQGVTGNVRGIFGERYHFEWILVVSHRGPNTPPLLVGIWGGEESS
jgi:hypothetical protein